MDDLISRQAAIEEVRNYFKAELDKEETKEVDGFIVIADTKHANDLLRHNKELGLKIKALPTAQERKWIPVTTRPMDEEERMYYQEIYDWELTDEDAVIFTSRMPEDGQEVWVCSKCGNVWQDTCGIDDGTWLEENGDWIDIVAWMPFERPEPWKGEEDATD